MAQQETAFGVGWVLFASIVLALVGVLNVFQGIALIAEDTLYVTGPSDAVVIVGDVTTWGWIILVIGVVECFAAFGVLVGQQWARWFGIVVASVALLAQFPVFFGAFPLWSFMVVLMCILVIYGLATYGGRNVTSD